MTRQTMIALGAAIVLGLLAVYLANSFLNASSDSVAAGGTTKIAVATTPLAYGTDITPEKVRFIDYPRAALPPGAYMSAAALMPPGKKRVALMPIAVNEPILASKISGEGKGASIAALLPAGKRAAAVRINDVSGVAGFVQPNDSVDVLVTRQMPNSGNQAAQITDILLQNVRVIAIDQQARNADGSPKIAKTATLEVDPLGAQKLALAQEVGNLSLVLRKPGEVDDPVVETVSMNDLRYNIYGGARYPAPAVVGSFGSAVAGAISNAGNTVAAAPRPVRRASSSTRKAPAPVSRSVEVYRGTKSDNVEVGGNAR